MKPKLLSLAAVAAWLFTYTPAQAGPSNPPGLENEEHYMCYQLKETKKVCWGTAGAPALCSVLTTGSKSCYGGSDDGDPCTVAEDCDTRVCQIDNCAGGTSPCYNGFPLLVQRGLDDQFEDKRFDIKKPKEICAPANKMGEDPGADLLPEHLEAYQTLLSKKNPDGSLIAPAQLKHVPATIVTQDQFGFLAVQTIKENRIFVPTLKSQVGPAGSPPAIDHYKCYKAKVLKKRCIGGANNLLACTTNANCPGGSCDIDGFVKLLNKNVVDQFQNKNYDILKLKQVCAPVIKSRCVGGTNDDDGCVTNADCDSNVCSDENTILNSDLHYTCYQVKQLDAHVPETGIRLNSQFAKEVHSTVKPKEICLPALKNPAPPSNPCHDDCDALITPGTSKLTFETSVATGNCGVLRNFRCSNDANAACAVNADCGAVNTCNEVTGGGIPLNLECGGLYTGGGGNSVPLPFPVPDMGRSSTLVTAYNNISGDLTLGPTTQAQVGERHCTEGRECSGNSAVCVIDSDCPAVQTCDTQCLFGPPLPIPNAMTPPTSVCAVNDVDLDASGTAECDGGASTVSTPLRSNVYLSGDLFTMITPPNIPGVQPCPLCDRLCVGGTDADFPCNANGDCNSNNCAVQETCLGGPNDGLNCTPATSDSAVLGDNQNAYPTSHDCPPEPSLSITDSIGGLPIGFSLTSGTIQKNAEDLNLGAGGSRVFAGFCRDINIEGSGCFEGDTAIACPVAGDLNGVPCDSDADCSAPYENCAQRTAGGFSRAAATQINVFGQTDGGCLGDGALHTADLVSVFDIPPTFNGVVDAAGDLPGPGAAMIRGEAQLEP